MPDRELTNYEASVLLKKAIQLNMISLKDDPLSHDFEKVSYNRDMTMYAFLVTGTSMNLLIYYSLRYKTRHPWYNVLGKIGFVSASCTFFYLTSASSRNYNEVLIKMSKQRKQELASMKFP